MKRREINRIVSFADYISLVTETQQVLGVDCLTHCNSSDQGRAVRSHALTTLTKLINKRQLRKKPHNFPPFFFPSELCGNSRKIIFYINYLNSYA